MNQEQPTSGLPGLAVLFLSVAGVLVLVVGALAILISRSFDTQYAPGYSERAFKSVQWGDTEDRVRSLLGPPLSTDVSEPYVEWIYSAKEQKHFAASGEGSGTFTTVHFNAAGQVTSVFGQMKTSANTYNFGEGQGYLSLTKDKVAQLKGKTQDEARQALGPPKAVYDYKASRLLRYSRSPSSSHYHLRVIGLDQDGRVVHVWREIYWD
jgi:outer membrane protein assembly factor BamE (lipoprotein component of BamABCDE complex)